MRGYYTDHWATGRFPSGVVPERNASKLHFIIIYLFGQTSLREEK